MATHFIGLSGEYYVCYALVVRGYHASLAIGNAPNVDVLVSSSDGQHLMSIQVKTSRFAYRNNRYGHSVYEWDVGASAIGRNSVNILYAFVDLNMDNDLIRPVVYLVPSSWVDSFVKPDHSRKMYLLKRAAADICRENWDIIDKYFHRPHEVNDFLSSPIDEAQWN